MPFTIPNLADAAFAAQAAPDKVDIDILQAGIRGDGVVSGCAVTAQGSPDMTVAVAAGTVRIDDVDATVTGGNVTITAANATNPRIDLVVVNSSGTKSATAGTAAASPVCPAIPATSVVLAMVYVPANDTTINTNQITDKRVDLLSFVSYSTTFASLPAASAANKGQLALLTDIVGGSLVRSDGSNWVAAAPGVGLLMTTKGDLIAGTGANTSVRLGVGTPGQLFMPDSGTSTGLAWTSHAYVGSIKPTSGTITETFPRSGASIVATVTAGGSGVLRAVAIWLPARQVITSISFAIGSTALVSGTNSWAALYGSGFDLLRQSNNNTSPTAAANSVVTFTLSSTFTTTVAGLHYLAVMWTASTMPTLMGVAGNASLNAIGGFSPSWLGNTGLTTTAPSTATWASAQAGTPYAYVS